MLVEPTLPLSRWNDDPNAQLANAFHDCKVFPLQGPRDHELVSFLLGSFDFDIVAHILELDGEIKESDRVKVLRQEEFVEVMEVVARAEKEQSSKEYNVDAGKKKQIVRVKDVSCF